MSMTEREKMIRELKELEQLKAEAEAEIETIKDAIKADMEKENTEEITAGVFKVRFAKVESSRFDTTAFKRIHADLYEQFCKKTVTKRFTIA